MVELRLDLHALIPKPGTPVEQLKTRYDLIEITAREITPPPQLPVSTPVLPGQK